MIVLERRCEKLLLLKTSFLYCYLNYQTSTNRRLGEAESGIILGIHLNGISPSSELKQIDAENSFFFFGYPRR